VKINISYPPHGSSQLIEVDDERKWRVFLDKRLSEEVPADSLGDEFKGYVFKITGGYDKEGFAMMQGVLLNHRTRLLLDGRTGQYRVKRKGCRKRKSVRGCIVGTDMSCINVMIVKRGPVDLPKLTDKESDRPSLRGPKRADNIRKAWGLSRKDDVRQYVMKRVKPGKDGKKDRIKSPKIQRLITPRVKARRRRSQKLAREHKEKSRKEAAEYATLLKQIRSQKRMALLSRRRGEGRSTKASTSERKSTTATTTAPTETKVTKATTKPTTTAGAKKEVTKQATSTKGGVQKPKNLATKKATEQKTTEKKPTTTTTSTTTTTTTTAKKTTEKKQPKNK